MLTIMMVYWIVFRYMPEMSVHKTTHILEVNKRHDATTATEEGLGREREALWCKQ